MVLSVDKSAGALVRGGRGDSPHDYIGVTLRPVVISGRRVAAGVTVRCSRTDAATLKGINPPSIREATEEELATFRREETDTSEERELEERRLGRDRIRDREVDNLAAGQADDRVEGEGEAPAEVKRPSKAAKGNA